MSAGGTKMKIIEFYKPVAILIPHHIRIHNRITIESTVDNRIKRLYPNKKHSVNQLLHNI